MSTGYQHVSLVGNLGQDPEIRYSQSGVAVCNLRIAVSERRKMNDEWKEHTEWFTVVCFGKTAENAGRWLNKGRQVLVEGKIQHRKWEDREGNRRESAEIVADRVVFLQGGADPDGQRRMHGGRQPNRDQAGERRREQSREPGSDDDFHDELPF